MRRVLFLYFCLLLTLSCGKSGSSDSENTDPVNAVAKTDSNSENENSGNSIIHFTPTFTVANPSISAPSLPNFSLVNISLHDKATEMMISLSSDFAGASWQSAATEATVSAQATGSSCGNKFIYLKQRRANGKESLVANRAVTVTCSYLISTNGEPSARYGETSIWTGTEMIVWGGVEGAGTAATASGAIYDPANDTWRTMAAAPEARTRHSAIWTGSKMLVWGGRQSYSGSFSTGVLIYDLASNSWTNVNAGGEPGPRVSHVSVWTGTEMIVWGGDQPGGDGARFSPTTGQWTAMSSVGVSAGRRDALAVWNGTEMLLWSGEDANSSWGAVAASNAKAYNPATDAWRDYTLPAAMNIYNSSNNYYGAIAAYSDGKIYTWGHRWGLHTRFANIFDTVTATLETALQMSGLPLTGDLYYSSGVWTGTDFILRGVTLVSGTSSFEDGIIFSPTPFGP